MINKDKAYHFIAGAVICTIGSIYSPRVGLILGFTAALAKEVWDHYKGGTVDGSDFVATVVGAVFANSYLMAGE